MALITAAARSELIALYVAMFKAAPGANNLTDMVAAYEAGGTTSTIAKTLAAKADFATLYPGYSTAAEFAASLVSNLLGGDVTAAITTWSTDYVVGLLNSGKTRADAIVTAVVALRATANTGFVAAQAAMANKVDVAGYYSMTQGQSSTNLGVLQGVIAAVTSVAGTTTTAKNAIDASLVGATSQTFALTTGVDILAGTSGNDTFTATHLTLTGNDDIRGGAGNDTLILIDTGTTPFTPNTSAAFDGIETVKIQNMNGSGASGVSAVTEKAAVTFSTLAAGKTLVINGLTLTATGYALPAETVAAAFLNGSTSSSGFSSGTIYNSAGAAYTSATAAVLTGTATATSILNGALNTTSGTTSKVWTAAAGADSKTLIFTNNITNSNVSDLEITGTGSAVVGQVNTYTFTGTTTASSYASFSFNGQTIGTSTVAATTGASYGAVFAAAVNAAAGATVATDSSGTVTVTGAYNIGPITTVVAATGVLAGAQVLVDRAATTSANTTIPTIVTTQGAAESSSSYTQGGVDSLTATKFVGTTSFVNDASTSGVKITSIGTGQVPTIQGDGVATLGSNEYGFTAVASPVLNIQGGGTSGTLTATGTSTTAATINVKDAPKTSTGTTGTTTVGVATLFNDSTSTTGTLTINTSNSNFTTGTLSSKAGSIVLTGNGAVTFGSTSTPAAIIDTNLTTIDATGLTTGGVFAKAPDASVFTTFKGGAGADTFVTNGAYADTAITFIDGGAGTADTLQLAAAADGNTAALAARFTNFEILKTPGSIDMSLYPGMTAVTATAASSTSLTNLNATQAAAVKQQDTSAGLSIGLRDSSGLSDVVKLSTSTISTATTGAAVSVTALVMTGVETLNYTNGASSLTAVSTLSFAGSGSTGLTTLTAAGSKPVAIDLAASGTPAHATTLTTIDASATTPQLTGTTTLTLSDTVGGHAMANGLIITTTGGDDVISLGLLASPNTFASGVVSTINAGAGNDNVKVTQGQLYTAGSGWLAVNGGTNGTAGDTLTILDTSTGTVNDGIFAHATGFENLALTNTGTMSLTMGGFFNQAFPAGVTITSGASTTSAVTVDATLYQSAVKFTNVGTTGVQTVTGSGSADTITITAAAAATGAGTVVINGGAGADTISVTDASAISVAASISVTGGTGADKITLALAGVASAVSVAKIVVAAGDSLAGAADTVTGFYVAGSTRYVDSIDFSGSAIKPATAVATTAVSGRAISELNYSVATTGLITFGGTAAATVTAAQVESMFANQLAYQLANLETVLWADGITSGNTYVFNHNILGDSEVILIGVQGTAVGGAAATASLIGIA